MQSLSPFSGLLPKTVLPSTIYHSALGWVCLNSLWIPLSKAACLNVCPPLSLRIHILPSTGMRELTPPAKHLLIAMSLYLKVLRLQTSQREICVSQHDINAPAKPQANLTMLNHEVIQRKSFTQVTETCQLISLPSTPKLDREHIQIADFWVFYGFRQDFWVFLRQLTSLPQRNMCLRATETVESICSEKMSFFFLLIHHFAKLCFPRSLALPRGHYCCYCCCYGSLLLSKMKAFRKVCAIFWIPILF